MKAPSPIASEVEAVISKMTDAYASRDIAGLMACFAPDDDIVLYGTGADEKRVGPRAIRAQAERDWAQTENAAMTFRSQTISAAGNVAWASMDGSFDVRADGEDISMPARVSVVLEKRGDRWLIVHAHFSLPAAGQQEGSSF